MVIENALTKFGFIKEESDLRLKKMIEKQSKLKEVYIDIYKENPLLPSDSFSLLLRTSENNAKILVDNDRLILKRDDQYETFIVNILISMIKECFSKINDNCCEYILNVQNVYYKITILN